MFQSAEGPENLDTFTLVKCKNSLLLASRKMVACFKVNKMMQDMEL